MSKKRTVLIVDRSTTHLATLYEYLSESGYRVLVSENSESTIECVRLGSPDIILLDTNMGEINGHDVCNNLKSNPSTSHIPIVFLSALEDNQTKLDSFKSGAIAHLNWPILLEELISVLETQFQLIELKRSGESELPQIDPILDIAAHEMNNYIMSISGFTYELDSEFEENKAPQEWYEYTSCITKSREDIEKVMEALILYKNLLSRVPKDVEVISVNDLISNVVDRYEGIENLKCLVLKTKITEYTIESDPILVEELLLILLRNLHELSKDEKSLSVHIKTGKIENKQTLIIIEAATRTIKEEELPYLLTPFDGKKRKRVEGTNMLLLCLQKIISLLSINAHVESSSTGLCFTLAFKTGSDLK